MRLLPTALCALFCASAIAQDAAAIRDGYAFAVPRILAQQRIFGLAHGITLLAAACADTPAAREAHAAWQTRQQAAIDGAVADLGHYYFGAPTERSVLAERMRLRAALDYAPDSAELRAACDTLPAALAQPRYDLVARLRLEAAMASVVVATAVEAHDRHCRERLTGLAGRIHEERYRVWREINTPNLEDAAATLERDWPADAPAASYADWVAALRKETRVGGSQADCLDFSASLRSPDTALRNVFRLPPPPRTTTPP